MAKEMVKAKPAKAKIRKRTVLLFCRNRRGMQIWTTMYEVPQNFEARREKMLHLWKPKTYGRRVRQAKKG